MRKRHCCCRNSGIVRENSVYPVPYVHSTTRQVSSTKSIVSEFLRHTARVRGRASPRRRKSYACAWKYVARDFPRNDSFSREYGRARPLARAIGKQTLSVTRRHLHTVFSDLLPSLVISRGAGVSNHLTVGRNQVLIVAVQYTFLDEFRFFFSKVRFLSLTLARSLALKRYASSINWLGRKPLYSRLTPRNDLICFS